MTPATADAEARQRILTDLQQTLFVEAGAGTGKTMALVARIVNLVADGQLRMEGLAAMTFTESAAAELRDRVREGLERAGCRRAVDEIDLATISTIHSFAGQLLRMFPLEAGLPPGFATLDEIQQALHFDERFTDWFWRDALQEPLRGVVKRALLLGMTQDTLRRLAALLDNQHDLLRPDTTWTAPEPPVAQNVAAFAGRRLQQLQRGVAYALDGERDPLVQIVRACQSNARQLLAALTEDEALAALHALGKLWLPEPVVERWKPALDGQNAGWVVFDTLREVSDRTVRTLDAHRSVTLSMLLGCLRDFVLAGVEERHAAGAATFHDLLAWTRDLLRDNSAVRHAAQERYQRIFIDEFQDTDPLQAEIAFYLAADERDGRALPDDWRDAALVPGKLFVVGDPKQSIYRFRGADIALYDDLLARLHDTRVRLTHNFRSVQPVLEFVNHHFDAHMRADAGFQPEYAPLTAQWPAHAEASCGVRRVGGLIDGNAGDAAEAEARHFAALARDAVEGGWMVSERNGGDTRVLRPATYRDICILVSARTHLRRLERALERTGVPYRVEAGKLVLGTQEVRDLLACLRSIEDASDQVALVAGLRSPAYACSDVDLLRWVEGGGRLDHEHPGEGPEGRVKDALASLAEFHQRRLLLSPVALIETFMAERLLVASAFGEPRPREAWRRLRYVVSRARAFTSTGRHTLRAFLDWIEGLQRAEVRDPESGSVESDEDAVHIQTIHGAKGLEYPIVLLGGLGASSRGRANAVEVIADRRTGRLACRAGVGWQTSDLPGAQGRERRMASAEAVRLLYVAATRARDHLVLSLFRGARSEDSAAAAIERGLFSAAPELCPVVSVGEYVEPADVANALAVDSADAHADAESERDWATQRLERLAAAAAPPAHPSWWSPTERGNMSLLAQVDGVLLEERIDLIYDSPDGHVLVLRASDDPAADLARSARVTLAFATATGLQPARVEIVA